MNRKATLLATAVLAGLIGVSSDASSQEVGDVSQEKYLGAIGTPPDQETRNLYFGNTVYANETVQTGNEGATVLTFLDDTELRLGSNATVVLDRFVYDPATGDGEAVITLSKGIMRFISGDMNPDGYSVRTPTATMAVRGTDFLVWLVPTTGATIVSVLAGQVDITGCGGHEASATGDESVRIRGDCSGADPTVPGRAVPSDSGTDGASSGEDSGSTHADRGAPEGQGESDGGNDDSDGGSDSDGGGGDQGG